ncbi:DUF5675 family protein [Desulfovibrio sp. JC010]|uniref:DUF5675 family protein n=1 Tax=Desulfovibrio sp. JC010 TaxID=2593641 RepID=UPI0013D17000|nr:hypothetical protein [Desulfovibrio sp. JC010]
MSKKIVDVFRVERTEAATVSAVCVDGKAICWFLEEPWKKNQPNISCIPAGRYVMKREFSPSKQRDLWTIKDVPGRTYVRIHTGNDLDDTEGCPLTGSTPDDSGDKRRVNQSTAAFKQFMQAMNGATEAEIVITEVARAVY